MKVNIGCGDRPTPGWVNIDNSPTVLLARTPLRFLLRGRSEFVSAVRNSDIRYGNALNTRLPTGSVSVLYSSHLLEHLDRAGASRFLAEARRVLRPGGILRLAVPDIRRQVVAYLQSGDADRFVDAMRMAREGRRRHRWMYDRGSLRALLASAGFVGITDLEPGETTIDDPAELDLREREAQSLYVDCIVPAPGEVASLRAPPAPSLDQAASRSAG